MMIGQEKIIRELDLLVLEITNGKNCNILFIGSSGSGKTSLGFYLLSFFSPPDWWYYTPVNGTIKFKSEKRLHFIDEVHTLSEFEFLYPIMDSEKYVIISATNEYGNIPEPFWRRCIILELEDYEKEHLKRIADLYFSPYDIFLEEEILERIAEISRGSPGMIKNLVSRLLYVFKGTGIPKDKEEFENILTNILNIKDGLSSLDRKYLKTLEGLGGKKRGVGLERISTRSRIPKNIILRDIEPYLISLGIIKIENGRMLNESTNNLRESNITVN